MNYSQTVKENKKIFEMNLKMLSDNNMQPIIVVLPTSRYYFKYFEDNYQKNKFYTIINEMKEIYNLKILDYFKSDMFEDDDFWDYSHLNKKGCEKFTNIIKNELEL